MGMLTLPVLAYGAHLTDYLLNLHTPGLSTGQSPGQALGAFPAFQLGARLGNCRNPEELFSTSFYEGITTTRTL